MVSSKKSNSLLIFALKRPSAPLFTSKVPLSFRNHVQQVAGAKHGGTVQSIFSSLASFFWNSAKR